MVDEKQTMTQRASGVVPDRAEDPEHLKMMAEALEEMQLALEPVRDQALDRKAFFTGYAQCAEEMIKAIVGKMSFLRNQAKKKEEYLKTMEEEAKEAEERKLKAEKSNTKKSRGRTNTEGGSPA